MYDWHHVQIRKVPSKTIDAIIRNSNFFEGLETFPWRRKPSGLKQCYAVFAPQSSCFSTRSTHSLVTSPALEYLEIVGFKIAIVMEWSRLLTE